MPVPVALRRLWKAQKQARGGPLVDKSSLAGIGIAIGGILLGLILEGGKITQLLQPTAAMIVFGGTLGAVMLQFPLRVILAAVRRLGQVFIDNSRNPADLIQQITGYAQKARKDGVVSLDKEIEHISDPFLKKALMLAVDGTEPQEIRNMMELELDNQAEHHENIPRVFESAGGFSPTIGIIGAVLGLIQVMQHLDDIGEVGRGIAVAFVATIYGVGAANLFFLPVAGKIKLRMRQEQTLREMMLEGVISILEGMNPRMIENKLAGFFVEANENANKRIAS
jgi:chemotaxis protein MotA